MRAVFCVLEQTDGLCLRAKFRLDRFLLSPSGGENPKFYHFIDLAFCGVASWWQSEKVEHRCTTTNLPLSNGIKIVSVLEHLHGEIGRTNSDVQKRYGYGQTNKKLNFFGRPVVGEVQAPPNLAW